MHSWSHPFLKAFTPMNLSSSDRRENIFTIKYIGYMLPYCRYLATNKNKFEINTFLKNQQPIARNSKLK